MPAEPSATDSNCVLLRLRWPGGAQETRRFRKSEPLRHLLTFAASRGYSTDRHRFWNSDVPKKDVRAFVDDGNCISVDDHECECQFPDFAMASSRADHRRGEVIQHYYKQMTTCIDRSFTGRALLRVFDGVSIIEQ